MKIYILNMKQKPTDVEYKKCKIIPSWRTDKREIQSVVG